MLKLTRLIGIGSFALLAAVALVLTLLQRQSALGQAIDLAQSHNLNLVRPLLTALAAQPAAATPEVSRSARAHLQHYLDTGLLLTAAIYTADGALLETTALEDPDFGPGSRQALATVAELSDPVSIPVEVEDGGGEQLRIVTFAPTWGIEGGGVIAIESDLSGLLVGLDQQQIHFLKVLVLGFGALYLILLVFARRANRTMNRQQQSIQCGDKLIREKNRQLEHAAGEVRRLQQTLKSTREKLGLEVTERAALN